MNDELVYYLQEQDGGPVKIGTTTNIESRTRTLQTSTWRDIVELACEPGGKDVETARHDQFAHLRIRPDREWFRAGPELMAHIARLADGRHQPVRRAPSRARRATPGRRRGRRLPRPVVALPVGLWRILASLLLVLIYPRRGARRRRAGLGIATAGGSVVSWTQLPPNLATIATVALVLAACLIAGWDR